MNNNHLEYNQEEMEEIDVSINALNDELFLENLKDDNGFAKDRMKEIVNIINEKLDINWDEARWDENYWDSVDEENYEHINYKIY